MWWALLAALGAAVAYGIASIMQAVAARAAPDSGEGVDPRLLIRLLRQWRFLVGLALDTAGFLAEIVALRMLPLFVVQAALGASVAVTAVVAALVLDARLGRGEWAAVVAVCAGLTALGLSAQQEGVPRAGWTFHVGLLVTSVALAAAGMMGAKFVPRGRITALGLVAGLEFGIVAIGGRVVTGFAPGVLLRDPATYAIAVAGVCAFLFYAAALQRGSVTAATAMVVVGETVMPALIGIVILGDRTRPGFSAVAIAGFIVAVAGALALARFGEVQQDAPTRNESAS
jgi:drug/metabolite transporter (DMT)-like permease